MKRLKILRNLMLVLCIMFAAAALPGDARPVVMPAAQAEESAELLRISLSARPAEMVEPGDATLILLLENISDTVDTLLANSSDYAKTIQEKFDSFLFSHNRAGEVGANYILSSLVKKAKEKKEKGE